MSKNKGYMLVRYTRYILPNEPFGYTHVANGKRLSTFPDYTTAKAKLTNLIDVITKNNNNASNLVAIYAKDLRKGFVIFQDNEVRLMLSIQPYSRHIKERILI